MQKLLVCLCVGQTWGVGGGGWGPEGVGFFYEISSEINCTHMYRQDLGGVPYSLTLVVEDT